MNKRLRTVFLLLILLVVVTIPGYFVLKASQNSRQDLQSNLARAIFQNQAGEIQVVDLSSITTFPWDKLYVFGPYTSSQRIDSILGNFWIGSRFTSIKSNDRITLLVFTRNGRVVQHLEFPRGQGDFSPADNGKGYAIEESHFLVDERGRIIWADNK